MTKCQTRYRGALLDRGSKLVVKVGKSNNTDFGIVVRSCRDGDQGQ